MAWVLDTNVLSEVRRKRPEPKVLQFLASTPARSLFTTTVTMAELRYGIGLVTDVSKRAEMERWFRSEVQDAFRGRVLEASEDILLAWRVLADEAKRSGRAYSFPDLLIAASAQHHDMTLVTRNTKDFVHLPIALFNPWVNV